MFLTDILNNISVIEYLEIFDQILRKYFIENL